MSILLIKLINLLISFVSVMVSGFCFAITPCYDRHDKAGSKTAEITRNHDGHTMSKFFDLTCKMFISRNIKRLKSSVFHFRCKSS